MEEIAGILEPDASRFNAWGDLSLLGEVRQAT